MHYWSNFGKAVVALGGILMFVCVTTPRVFELGLLQAFATLIWLVGWVIMMCQIVGWLWPSGDWDKPPKED